MPIIAPSIAPAAAAYEYRLIGACLPYGKAGTRGLGSVDRAGFVEGFARVTEVLLVGGAVIEICLDRGAETLRDVRGIPDESVVAAVRALSGLDPEATLREHDAWLKAHATPQDPPPWTRLDEFQDLLIGAASAILGSRIDTLLVEWAGELRMEVWGHRVTSAGDGLRAYLRRHDDGRDQQLMTVGRMYAEGRLSLRQAAEILDSTVEDLVVEFERHHFCRPVETVLLGDEDRSARLERLRHRRLEHGHRPNSGRVAREVIATQRVEGVDARKWVADEDG